MNLERFVERMHQVSFATLQIGSPFSSEIRFCAYGDLFDEGVDRFAWVEAPLNSRNYALVSKAFEEAFGHKF